MGCRVLDSENIGHLSFLRELGCPIQPNARAIWAEAMRHEVLNQSSVSGLAESEHLRTRNHVAGDILRSMGERIARH